MLEQDKVYITNKVKELVSEKIKGYVSSDLIGDALVVSITGVQDIVYTYTTYVNIDCNYSLETRDILSQRIAKKACKRYKSYIKNLFFKEKKSIDILDTTLYTR